MSTPLNQYGESQLQASQSEAETEQAWGLQPRWLLLIMLGIPVFATLCWWLGQRYLGSSLGFMECQQFIAILSLGVVGGYQLYFWVQRNNGHRPAFCVKIGFDDKIPFQPRWIWPYSLLYYVMIGVTVLSVESLAQGIHYMFGGLMLLVIGCAVFYLMPTYVPASYRRFEVNSPSTRYLAFVQSMDNEHNAFPSMHCALATYVGLILMQMPMIGVWIASLYVIVIAVSCLLVKQHVIIDTLGGILLGGLVFQFNEALPGWFS